MTSQFCTLSPELLRKKKQLIFFCALAIDIFTSMSKIVVPGSVFSSMGQDLGCSAAMLTAIGSAYMYAYAVCQLSLGLFSDRMGGVRLLLFGGTLFVACSLLLPTLASPYLIMLIRALTAFGSGTLFLALSKLVADLYPDRFGMMMGLANGVGYVGVMLGGLPVVCLVDRFGWRLVLFTCAIIPLLFIVLAWCLQPGTMKPISPGRSSTALKTLFTNGDGLYMFLYCGCVFGVYYSVVSCIGLKALEDCMGISRVLGSAIITSMTMVPVVCNVLTGLLLKLFRHRRHLLLVLTAVVLVLGALLSGLAFQVQGQILLVLGFALMAVSAGCFSFFADITKDIYPAELTAFSMAVLNCAAFIGIALLNNLTGMVLKCCESSAANGVYPGTVYRNIFLCFALVGVVGVAAVLKMHKTYGGKD